MPVSASFIALRTTRSQNAESYVEALRKYRVRYVFGYSSALSALAHLVLETGVKAAPLVVAVSNAEPLFESQRRVITQAFGCPVRSTYGMAEIVTAASECGFGALHEWPDVGITEILRDDLPQPAEGGTAGRLVCSGLLNLDMPLVRYETGDRGTAGVLADCACGRRLPVFGAIEGRLTMSSIPRTAAASDASIQYSRLTLEFARPKSSRTGSIW